MNDLKNRYKSGDLTDDELHMLLPEQILRYRWKFRNPYAFARQADGSWRVFNRNYDQLIQPFSRITFEDDDNGCNQIVIYPDYPFIPDDLLRMLLNPFEIVRKISPDRTFIHLFSEVNLPYSWLGNYAAHSSYMLRLYMFCHEMESRGYTDMAGDLVIKE
jgi:hypothetical protein